jgi:hypothetical protein
MRDSRATCHSAEAGGAVAIKAVGNPLINCSMTAYLMAIVLPARRAAF